MGGFTLQEAFELIHRKVVLNDESGFVIGLLALNPEVEVVVKLTDDLKQFTKDEFNRDVRLVVDG